MFGRSGLTNTRPLGLPYYAETLRSFQTYSLRSLNAYILVKLTGELRAGPSRSARSTPPPPPPPPPPRHRTRNGRRTKAAPEPRAQPREPGGLEETRRTRAAPRVQTTKQTQPGPVSLPDEAPAPEAPAPTPAPQDTARTRHTSRTSAGLDAERPEPPTSPLRPACTEYVVVTPKQTGRGPAAGGSPRRRVPAEGHTVGLILVSEKAPGKLSFWVQIEMRAGINDLRDDLH